MTHGMRVSCRNLCSSQSVTGTKTNGWEKSRKRFAPLTESLPRCDFPVELCGVRGLPGLRLHCKFQRRERLLQDLESKEWSVKYMNEYFNAALCFETSISCAPSQVLAAFAGWMAC